MCSLIRTFALVMIKSFHAQLVKRLLFGGVAAMLLWGCSLPRRSHVVVGKEDFRSGDLVLRCGYGTESRVVTAASRSAYSHIGILYRDCNGASSAQWMVIHAVPDEAEEGEAEYVKCEPLSCFFATDRASCGAWMRVDCPDSLALAAAKYAHGKVEAKVEFDRDYLLSDTTRLYCTELVYRAYLHQGLDITSGHRHQVPTLFSTEGACVFPNDIEESNLILFVQPFKTQQQ